MHIPIASAEIAQQLTQLTQVFSGLFRPANVGARNDFHQRNAGPVQIDERHFRVHIVDGLARILLKVNALDANRTGHARFHIHQHFTLTDDGVFELADLITLRQIRIEVVLAIKH